MLEPPPQAVTRPCHYDVLGVELTSSAEEIKRSYRRLALRYHPDKNAAEGHKFREISLAYAILSSPSKRKVYDRYGNQGLHLVESLISHGLPSWLLTPAAQCSIVASACMLSWSVLLFFPAFVLLRIDDVLSWPWVAVLAPLWIVNAVFCAGIVLLLIFQFDGRQLLCRVCASSTSLHAFACLALFFAFEMLMCFKLDHRDGGHYNFSFAMTPLLALLVLPCARLALHTAWRSLLAITVVFIAFKLDAIIDANWWWVLLPLWLIFALLALYLKRAWVDITTSANRANDERTILRLSIVCSALVLLILIICLLLLSFLLGGQAQYSAMVIFTPYFILLGIICICMCCCIVCGRLASAPKQSERAQRVEEDTFEHVSTNAEFNSILVEVAQLPLLEATGGAGSLADVVTFGQQLSAERSECQHVVSGEEAPQCHAKRCSFI